jgi:uncharacterized OB-fold protein
VRGILASALHCATASADVDGFTLAARAVELLGPGEVDVSTVRRMILVGDLPPTAAEDLPRFLGVPAAVQRPVVQAPSLNEALAVALATDLPGPALVVAASAPRTGSSVPPTGPDDPCDVAISLWVDERGPSPEPFSPDAVAPLTIDQLVHEAGEHGALWGPRDPSGGRGVDPASGTRETPLPPDLPVAQGAYVPWPRYAEGTYAHWNLMADRCAACGALTFPPRGRCRSCGETGTLHRVRLDAGSGRVVASTRIAPGGQPTEFDDQVGREGSYGVVIVEFEGGVRATLQVADHAGGPLAIGSRVGTELRRSYPMEGRWRYARKAVPRSTPELAAIG